MRWAIRPILPWACSKPCCCSPGTAFLIESYLKTWRIVFPSAISVGFPCIIRCLTIPPSAVFAMSFIKRVWPKPLLDMINAQIQAGGLEIKAGVIVDASLLESARRPKKQQDVFPVDEDGHESESKGGGYDVETTYSGDSEAAWTVKGKKFCYGYKAHIAVDAEHGFILSGHATPANRADCKELMAVVRGCGLDEGAPVFADKGYSGQQYRQELEEAGYFDGIMYKAARSRPLSEPQRLVNRAISRFRGRVERAFGTLKRNHRMARARYLGAAKVGLQLLLDAMAFNLKKAVRLAST